MSKIMKRFLAISLTVLMMLSAVSVFATESGETGEIEEPGSATGGSSGGSAVYLEDNFNDGNVSSWSEGAAFSSADYGYLEFTATEDNTTLTRAWESTDTQEITVDFKIKAITEGEGATVSLNVAGAALTLTPASDKLNWGAGDAGEATMIPKLWYDVRVAIKDNDDATAKVANVWVDGTAYDATIAVDAIGNSFTATLANGETIGIDDVVVYAYYKEDGLKSTALDFKFDGFKFTSNTTKNENNSTTGVYVLPTIEREATKNDKYTGFPSTTSSDYNKTVGYDAVMSRAIRTEIDIETVKGKFGKSKDDASIYWHHKTGGTSFTDMGLDFSFGEYGKLLNKGDKQVISFNMAFTEDVPEAMIIRTYNWTNKDGVYTANGKWLAHASDSGWVMKIYGDRMYLFGSTNYYSITPALMPGAWNNFRLEITSVGDETNAATYSAYVNDVAVAENINLTVAENLVREGTGSYTARDSFWGIHRLMFNYYWGSYWNETGGLYLDDVKVENYYTDAEYNVEPSPMLKAEGGSLQNFEWAVNKYVQGSVVYVDENQTLSEYEKSLDSKENKIIIEENGNVRFIEAIFRDKDGNVLDKESTFGANEVFGEFIKSDYTRTYATFVSENTELTRLDGDESGTYEAGADDVYPGEISGWEPANKAEWQADFYTSSTSTTGSVESVSSKSGLGAKGADDVFLSINNKVKNEEGEPTNVDDSRHRVRYAVTPEYNSTTANSNYTYADAYRPITVEFSILLENQSDTARLLFWRSEGPYNAKDISGNTVEARKQNGMMFFSYNSTTGKNEIKLKSTSGELVSNYNVGEWNRIAVSYYPGYHQFRLDVSVNGKLLKPMWKYQNKDEEASNSMLAQVINAIQFDTYSTATSNVYLDDVRIFTGYYDHAPETPALVSADDNIVIEKDTKSIVLKDSKTKNELLNALAGSSVDEILGVYKTRTYVGDDVTVAEADTIEAGNIVAVQMGEIIEYYEVAENKFAFKLDNSEIAGDLTEGTTINVSAYAKSATAKIIVAQYDENRKLIEGGLTIASAANGTAKASSVEVKVGAKIVKAMLWDGFADITPELIAEERNVIEAPTEEETEEETEE